MPVEQKRFSSILFSPDQTAWHTDAQPDGLQMAIWSTTEQVWFSYLGNEQAFAEELH